MRNKLLIILCTVTVGLTGVVGVMYVTKDRQAPEITVEDADTRTYKVGETNLELLQGVSAVDGKDGDVTDSLIVEKVSMDALGTQATVTYAAVDHRGNVAKLSQTYAVGEGNALTVTSQTAPVSEGEPDAGEPTEAPTEQEQPTDPVVSDAEAQEAAAVAETDAAIAALPTANPEFRISQHYLTLETGADFSPLSYVSDISDDRDSRDSLYEKIQIDGSVDTHTPGTYDLSYYVTDSSGNKSNTEVLHVVVQ